MCGICGIVHSNKDRHDTEALVKAMCDVIHHRGPDEDGYYLDEDMAMGMRRLKIIDLSTGSQPIYNEDKSIVVIFNGEIYNFQELRDFLIQKGHQFYTRTDTEVIVHLYEEFKEQFVEHLNGMFGIALWDIHQKKLILTRDRMGEKPLYYAPTKNGLIFGSELKSILCNSELSKQLEPKAVYHYFTFGFIPSPLSVFKNIYKLGAGEYLVYQGGNLTIKRYWNLSPEHELHLREEEIAERLYHELERSVKMRLISDVPLGAFLSGGIDSSIMVALMSQASPTPVKTFSIGLDDPHRSELPFARAVAEKYSTEHHELIARPDALQLVDQVVWHFDEPFGDSSAIPTFIVSQLTRDYVTVAISGDGGDELFGGYTRYQRIANRALIEKIPKRLRVLLSETIGKRLPFGFRAKAFIESLKYDNYDFFVIGSTEETKAFIFSNDFKKLTEGISSTEVSDVHFLKSLPLLKQCMRFDLNVYLPDDILIKVDRMSMANSLETRAPFLDPFLVEFAMQIPDNLKLKNNVSKYILKQACKDLLPEKIFTRGKSGFSIPLEEWFRRDLKPLLAEVLSRKQIEEVGVLSPSAVNTVISQHLSGKRNHKRLLWMMMIFQLWYQNYYQQVHPNISKALTRRGIR